VAYAQLPAVEYFLEDSLPLPMYESKIIEQPAEIPGPGGFGLYWAVAILV
jgi:hypothetical protein